MFQEGQPRRLELHVGDVVRVPHPEGGGTVVAVVVTPAEPDKKVRNVWVRYREGPEAGDTARIDVSYVERA